MKFLSNVDSILLRSGEVTEFVLTIEAVFFIGANGIIVQAP